MKKYTKEIHAARLRGMLKRKQPCICCPPTPRYNDKESISALWSNADEACKICLEFVGLKFPTNEPFFDCPCCALGDKAIDRTILALEEYESNKATNHVADAPRRTKL